MWNLTLALTRKWCIRQILRTKEAASASYDCVQELYDAMSKLLDDVRVLDGGFASELEYLGAEISGPLWSAHVLEDAPEKVVAVHRMYLDAGADCISTASYQVSRLGYVEYGLPAEQADQALRTSVRLARQAVAEWRAETGAVRKILVAASLGPFGAALHNGSEYSGEYGVSHEQIVHYHRERIEALAAASAEEQPDLLAFETLPSLDEARAIEEAKRGYESLPCWLSFTCRNEHQVAHGELLRECAKAAAKIPSCVAVGVNCTHPSLIGGLLEELQAGSGLAAIVYPNSGEGWDAERRVWTGASDAAGFGASAKRWFAAGAQIVGGCCRTRPEHISRIREAAQQAH